MPNLDFIGSAKHKAKEIVVLRDQHGKFYVKMDGFTTQKKLNAKEVVLWFLNAMNENNS